jgi:hypothetical protein
MKTDTSENYTVYVETHRVNSQHKCVVIDDIRYITNKYNYVNVIKKKITGS